MQVLIMAGDEGRQPYVKHPLDQVTCDDDALERLLLDLDRQLADAPRKVWLGVADDTPMLHERLAERGLAPAIHDVLAGRARRLRLPSKAQLQAAARQGDPAACYVLGRMLGEGGRPWLTQAARKGHQGAMEALGDAFWLERLVQANPGPERLASACHRLSVLAERAGDLDAAIAWLERGPAGPRACLRLGRLHRALGQRERAIAWLTRALAHAELAVDEVLAARRELAALGAEGVHP